MYQALVLTLGVLLVVGGGYLITNIDKQGVILSSTSVPASTSTAKNKASTLPGTYVCDAASGCQNPRTLSLYENGELRMNTNFDNGVEIVDESGSWVMRPDGTLTLILTGTSQELYATPRALSIKYVSSTTLSGIRFDTSVYKDIKTPVFLKQGEQTLDQTEPTGGEFVPSPAE